MVFVYVQKKCWASIVALRASEECGGADGLCRSNVGAPVFVSCRRFERLKVTVVGQPLQFVSACLSISLIFFVCYHACVFGESDRYLDIRGW